jgi:hypothetical protein
MVMPHDPLSDLAALIRVGAESGDAGAVRAAEAASLGPSSADPGADLEALIQLAGVHGGDEAMRAAGALRLWLDTSLPLEQCLGRAPGFRSARRQSGKIRLLYELAKRFPALSGRRLTRAIFELELAYRKRWPADCAAGTRPLGAEGLIYDILKLCDGKFPSFGRVREILG